MARNDFKSWLFPKQVRLKRKSVDCNSSAQWIDLTIGANEKVPPKKPSRRTCSSVCLEAISIQECDEENAIVVSPTSSLEDEYLTYSGHELLAIESSEQCFKSTEITFDQISDSSSLSASQVMEMEKLPVEPNQTYIGDLPQDAVRYTSTIEYLSQLRNDKAEAPYVSLVNKLSHEAYSNGVVLERLHKLLRRLNSERSIWLHQRELQCGAVRESKLFRIDSNYDTGSSGLPGIIGFLGTILERPFESPTRTTVLNEIRMANRKNTVVLLIPISGTNGCTISHNTPEMDSTVLLGDVIKIGDVLRIHSPWSCITNEVNTKPPLFHSFFWVERVRDRDLPAWYTTPDFPVSSSLMPSPISIACSCLASGSKSSISNCSKRFRDPHIYTDSVETVMPQNLNMDCVFVVHSFKLWIMKKMRPAILVQFYSGGAGLILLPSHAPPSNSDSRAKLTSWTRPQMDGVYHTQNLLQLPTSHLPRKFLASVSRYLTHFERQMNPLSARKFRLFRNGSEKTLTTAFSNPGSMVEFGLWDAGACKFQLIELNWIGLHLHPSYQIYLPALSRCQVTGFFLFQIHDGSHLQVDELNRIRSSLTAPPNSTDFSEILCQAIHIFYLWLRCGNSHTVLPCVCLPNVVLPCHLGLSEPCLPAAIDSTMSLIKPFMGCVLRLEHVLSGPELVILDWFSTVETSLLWHNTGYTGRVEKFKSLLLENCFLLNSADCLENLKPGNLVRFSGVISRVHTKRSHIWPVCAYCQCADLRSGTRDPRGSLYCQRCGRCLDQLEHQEQRFEVEVTVGLDTTLSRGLPHPLGIPNPQVVLNLSTPRLVNLLGLSARELADAPRMNPKAIIYKRVEDVLGLVLQSSKMDVSNQSSLTQYGSSTEERILIAELSECGPG